MAHRTRVGTGLFGVAVLAAVMLLWQQVGSPPSRPPTGENAALAPAPARSTLDTRPDGDFSHRPDTPDGALSGVLAYGELKRLFDYYLSTVGELTIEAITVQIQRDIEQRVAPAQVPAAKRLLALYLDFKRELVKLEQKSELKGVDAQAIRLRFLAMQDLRSQYFSAEETRGMFGFEDAYDQDAIARLEVSQDRTLSAAQRSTRLEALDAAMPTALREDRDAPRIVTQLEAKAQQMRAGGASEDEVYRMRSKALGAQAASRLAGVDREEQAWKSRIDTYLQERQQLIKSQSELPEAQRQQALSLLQQTYFSAEERPRLAAYEP